MRLQLFLTEETVSEKIDILKTNCKYYIDNFISKNIIFYRGDRLLNLNSFKKIPIKTDRSPVGTPKILFSYINTWLQKNKMNRRDSSLIVTTDKEISATFGYTFCIFPAGKFEYTYCKAKDFNFGSDKYNVNYFAWDYIKHNPTEWSNWIHLDNKTLNNPEYFDYSQNAIEFKKHHPELDFYKDYLNSNDPKWHTGIDYTDGAALLIDKLPGNTIIKFSDIWNSSYYDKYNNAIKPSIKSTVNELNKNIKDLKNIIIHNKNIIDAVNNSYELWINPSYFYAVDIDTYNKFIHTL